VVKIVVCYGEGLISKLARNVGGLTWSHAALYHNDYIIESSAHGVVKRSWDDFEREITEYQILTLKDGLSHMQECAVVSYAHGNIGKPYNYLGLFKIAWRVLKEKLVGIFALPSYICSGLVYDCFKYIGIDLVPGADELVLPDDIADSDLLKQIA